MCGDHLKNGISTDSSIYNDKGPDEADEKKGRHETWFDFNNCDVHNDGNGDSKFKFGFECPNERDQYPYYNRITVITLQS